VHSIEFERQARKDLRQFAPKQMRQIHICPIDGLAQDPRPHGCEKVKTMPGYLRIRSGEYRILYEVKDKEKLVIINRIRHRREAYR
jgi:mRNA interferase RelE/StbE